MERTLASVKVIGEINPIPGADSIEVAKVDGWHIVTKKGQFKVGDKCVYCEIDSIMPARPEFAFLADRHYKIRTIKLRGQVSQGIAFPLEILQGCNWPESLPDLDFPMVEDIPVNTDVTEALGVTKYEPPIPTQLRGRVRGPMNRLVVPKTDEMRVQAIPGVLERHKGETFWMTEKINGTSMSVYIDPNTGLHVCSRNVDLKQDVDHKWNGDSYWRYTEEHGLEEILKQFGSTIAIQGELFGPGIQKDLYKQKDLQYRVFNYWDMVGHTYLEHDVMIDSVQAYGLGDFLVPYLGEITLDHDVDSLLALSDGSSYINGDTLREGIVFRPIHESTDYQLGRLSFKCVSNKHLLKYGE